MKIVLMIVSVLLIVVVLLQSDKASDAGQIITGGNNLLMGQLKERGPEKFMSRFTFILGFLFIVLSLVLSL